MMNSLKLMFALLLLGCAMPVVTACDQDEGTFEEMGEKLDQTGEELREDIQEATE